MELKYEIRQPKGRRRYQLYAIAPSGNARAIGVPHDTRIEVLEEARKLRKRHDAQKT